MLLTCCCIQTGRPHLASIKHPIHSFDSVTLRAPQAINQKNLTTWAVKTSFTEPFQSVQSCLPLSLTFNTANDVSITDYQFSVNTTDLECADL